MLTAEPTEGAYTNDIVDEAYALLGDSVDINGADFEPIEVTPPRGRRLTPTLHPTDEREPTRTGQPNADRSPA